MMRLAKSGGVMAGVLHNSPAHPPVRQLGLALHDRHPRSCVRYAKQNHEVAAVSQRLGMYDKISYDHVNS